MDAVGGLAAELGYDRLDGALLRVGDAAVDLHPFAPELRAILRSGSSDKMGVDAVFCFDRVPTVCLINQASFVDGVQSRNFVLRSLCERLWNQSLVRLVLVASDTHVEAWSVDNADVEPERTARGESLLAQWSFRGLTSGEVLRGRDKWFDPTKRVDRDLLDEISVLVDVLVLSGLEAPFARRLIAHVIFVTYLEQRKIIGSAYRLKAGVRELYDLVGERDGQGLTKLFAKLRVDFNGDFLNVADGERGWETLPAEAFDSIHQFLGRTSLKSGQSSFWRFDFSHIPIELIAGIYETFLAQKDLEGAQTGAEGNKRRQGAYYTPRVLADWVVDLAFHSRDVTKEKIFDPACGSGMLLTSAYRRLVRVHEQEAVHQGNHAIADFATRKRLLCDHIFGADIDEDACQLTCFSLYLALLADLSPSDLAELRAGGHRLPSLTRNIRRGAHGDFFSETAAEETLGKFSIVLSNPPWRKLNAAETTAQAMAAWAERQPQPKPQIPKNQIAAAFALGAADLLSVGGRAALILPIGLLVSNDPTQRRFRAHLLGRYRILKVVNFADMRRLIFADAMHPFAVLLAEARPVNRRFQDVEGEWFDYWTPKTDMSLALGRLAVHGADRANLPAAALIDESPQLGLRYWGSEIDVGLLNKLWRHGRVRDLVDRYNWIGAKGFHLKDEDLRRDRKIWYVDAPSWMRGRPFLRAQALPKGTPVLPQYCTEPFPFVKIARVPSRRLFEGPRIIWPDGAHPEAGVNAIYADTPFSFQHSLAVLSAPDTEDGRTMAKFLTAYLRSPMALWLLLLLSGSFVAERPKLHIQEALNWPFWPPDVHPAPAVARDVLREVEFIFNNLSDEDNFFVGNAWSVFGDQLNACVYRYFGLSDSEVRQIEELASYAGPALQPGSLNFKTLTKPIRQPPSIDQAQLYCRTLQATLEAWRDATGGQGEISAAVWTGKAVPIGAAVLTLGRPTEDRIADDDIVHELIRTYQRLAQSSGENLMLVPDMALVDGARIYLIKPLIARFWLERSATEDASRLASELQAIQLRKTIA